MTVSNWMRSRSFEMLMWQRSRPALVERALKGRPARRAEPISGSRLRVTAVQRDIHLTSSAEQYALESYTLTAAAAAYGAQLVCFPEYNGIHLLGLLPDPGEIEELALSELFLVAAPAGRRVFESTWSGLARLFGLYIVAGSIVLPDAAGQLYSTLVAYDPAGRRIGEQRKLNPLASEREWIAAGDHLSLFHLPTTRLTATIGLDLHYWETGRIASNYGAEILVNAGSSEEPFSWWSQARGGWSRAQEVCAFAIQPMLVGSLFGVRYYGCSSIYAPLELAPTGDGILAVAGDDSRETVLSAELDLAALRVLRREAQLPRRELVEHYLARLYGRQPAPPPPPLDRARVAPGRAENG